MGAAELEAGVGLDALDRAPDRVVRDVLDPAAALADEVVMVSVRDLVLAAVGAEVGADEQAVVDEPVERAVDRRPVERRAGGPDRELDVGCREVPALRLREHVPDERPLPRLPARDRLGPLAHRRRHQLRSSSAPQRSSMRRVFQRMTENAQVTTKRPTTT